MKAGNSKPDALKKAKGRCYYNNDLFFSMGMILFDYQSPLYGFRKGRYVSDIDTGTQLIQAHRH